jgi:hypothetical protein
VELRLTDAERFGAARDQATLTPIDYSLLVACTPTPDASIGARCAASTSADAIAPGTVKEGWRTLWQLGQIRVLDGGADSQAGTADNGLFATQGLFVP